MKKLLALVLALVMVFSVAVTASAAGVKLEKHPYEKPARELPYETWQTVPKTINTPTVKVTTDWKADGSDVTIRVKPTSDWNVANVATQLKLYKISSTTNELVEFDQQKPIKPTIDPKTGDLVISFEGINLGYLAANAGGKFAVAAMDPVKMYNNKGEEIGKMSYRLNYKWDPYTDTASLVDYTITTTDKDGNPTNVAYAAKGQGNAAYKDGMKVESVTYYPDGKCKSLKISHVDVEGMWTDEPQGEWIGKVDTEYENDTKHDYTDNDHTDHRFETIELFYNKDTGRLDKYEYKTEIGANDYTVKANGDVLKATVTVAGKEYKYMTAEQYAAENNCKVSDVKPGQIGWFTTVTVKDEDGKEVNVTVACAAPAGYEKGFKDTVHLFAKRHWYPKNTIGVVGLSLRDEFPGLTDKWINIVPVDLTLQGTQEIELVAGNMFHIGKAFVDVDGDNVTVTYAYANNVTEAFSECVKWFKNVDEITSEFCENPASELVFGQPVSIANDLGGQEVALLYICNSATYYQTFITKQDAPTRYYENLKKWQNYRAGLYELLEKIPE